MGSRRTTQSSSTNGRSGNGADVSASSRPTGCSYLSNVRPENRSTLCSVIAQLMEETQPSFETTLKSKAVSENSNVKFSCVVTGHPVPQVIWYKDDVQLDRYCGLPKYEIFRNGQNHSLHIYNCALEDAAIYQASASNTKGIVSCSGVLEVGEMNEFKIHQRYFAKIKQKAESRHREQEGKENLEPLRTISPDRTLRKRRSTMEAFLSTPSSTEDEGNEESRQVIAVESDAALLETTLEEVKEKPVPCANGALSTVINGQSVSENGSKPGTYIYDSAQKVFTTHQPKTPSLKKKIRISNSGKAPKQDTPAERASEERRAKDEASNCLAQPVQSKRNSVEVMEVENTVGSSPVVDPDSRNVTDQKSEKLLFHERPSKDDSVPVEETSQPSQKQQLTVPLPPAVLKPAGPVASRTDSKQAAKHEREAGRKAKGERPEVQNQIPHISRTRQQTSAATPSRSKTKDGVFKAKDVTAMDAEEKSSASTGATLGHRVSAKAPSEGRTALPQARRGQTGDQLSEKETDPSQKNVSESLPTLLNEVTPSHTKMNRNDAPVSFELPPQQRTMETQPRQKTPSKADTSTAQIQTPSISCSPQATIKKTTQDTQERWRGSSESHTVLFTEPRASPSQSPGGAEKSSGDRVSPSGQHSQVVTAVKTVKETKVQVKTKAGGEEVCRPLVQSDSQASDEKVEMETESADQAKLTETENSKAHKGSDVIILNTSDKHNEETSGTIKIEENTTSEPQLSNLKLSKSDPVVPGQRKTQQDDSNLPKFQMNEFQELQKPVTKVVSVAELLRMQIKSLDSILTDSVTTIPAHDDKLQNATPIQGQGLRENGKCKSEVKESVSVRKNGANVEDIPPKNLKETLMELYHQLITDQEQTLSQDVTLQPVQASIQTLSLTPISVVDTGTTPESASPHISAKKYEKHITKLETGKSGLVSNQSGSHGPGSPLAATPIKFSTQESNNTVLKQGADDPSQDKDLRFTQKITPEIKLNSKTQMGEAEILLDQYKMDEHNTECGSSLNVERPSIKSKTEMDIKEKNLGLIEGDSPKVEEFLRMDGMANSTTMASPLLERRNCVSAIPSATAQELASGARRKIQTQKAKPEEAAGAASPVDTQTQKKEDSAESSRLAAGPVAVSPSPKQSRRSPLLQPPSEQTSPAERHSPLLNRRKMSPETQSQQPTEDIHAPKTEGNQARKERHDQFKAPQVIRKIRSETFGDASGHLKVWCQFFNVLSDSKIKWYRNEEEIAKVERNAGDEGQVNLAIVQASGVDSGVYGCTITNEYGTDSTDCLLSAEILRGMCLREDLGVGEEIEMTPMVFNKGVADSGSWGNKFFGRIMIQESQIGAGCLHKVWRAKVIYGLEPVFESGNTCIIKARNHIAYGGKGEGCLADRNLEVIKQECKIQNLAREYCKIFSAEARVIENFGPTLEVVPLYLMYRPANTVPYATVEADLTGVYQRYSVLDHTGRMDMRTGSDVEQKCCALQHWIYLWTSGNMLLTRLEGVDTKITNVGISVKSTGYQGLSIDGNPKVFEHFVSQHRCNYFCGLLSLRSLKAMDSLLTTAKPKGSKSPLLQRKVAANSPSPGTARRAAGSPKLPRKTEQVERKAKTADDSTTA